MVILDPMDCYQFYNAATWLCDHLGIADLCDHLGIADDDRGNPIDNEFEQAFNCTIHRPYPYPYHLEQVRIVFYNDADATAFLLKWS